MRSARNEDQAHDDSVQREIDDRIFGNAAGRKLAEGYYAASRAAAHADRALPAPLWSKVAWVRFLEYLLHLRMTHDTDAHFTTEGFRAWARTHSLPEPPDSRAFGNITRKAAKQKLIRDTDIRSKEGSHGREIVVWEVV